MKQASETRWDATSQCRALQQSHTTSTRWLPLCESARLHRSRFAEDSRALFVTTNRDLARVARAFLRREHPLGYLPPCVSDFTLTNLLWLKAPTAAPSLPLLQLIADSYALIQPSDTLWDQYVNEVTRLQARKTITQSGLLPAPVSNRRQGRAHGRDARGNRCPD